MAIDKNGSEQLANISLDDFNKAKAKKITVFKAKVLASNVIDYVKDGVTRQLAIVDCRIGDGITTGITSPTMVNMMLSYPDREVQLTFTGERYSDYAKETQPTFDLKLVH